MPSARAPRKNAERSGEVADHWLTEAVLHKGRPDGQPRSPGVQRKTPRCDMTIAALARQFERMAPALLLVAMTGLVVGFAAAGLA